MTGTGLNQGHNLIQKTGLNNIHNNTKLLPLPPGASASCPGVRSAVRVRGGVRAAGPDAEQGRPGGGEDAGLVPL